MKKGLGTIPKGLAWINTRHTNTTDTENSIQKTSQKGLGKGWTRATFIIQQELCDKLKALAYWNRTTVKEIVDEALGNYLKNKKIKTMPNKKQI